MRVSRTLSFVFGTALVGTSLIVGLWTGRSRAMDNRDSQLRSNAEIQARRVQSEFLRSQAVVRILAQNPALNDVQNGRLTSTSHGQVTDALGYLEQLYPGLVSEACLIDRTGREVARIVDGVIAPETELSTSEKENEFFAPTFAGDFDQVYQSAPYVSADTGEWVISNSTLVPNPERERRVIVHFEIGLTSFDESLQAKTIDTQVLDREGRTLIDTGSTLRTGGSFQKGVHKFAKSHQVQLARDQPGFPTLQGFDKLVGATQSTRLVTIGTRRLAYRLISPIEGNVNDWILVTSAPNTIGVLAGVGPFAGLILLLGVAALLFAVKNERAYQETLGRMARTDHLTGLANRVQLRDRCDHALRLSRRDGSQTAVLLLDLDSFKEVNDTLGHHQGDILLKEVTARLLAVIRDTDTLARLGGDEFAIVMPNVDGLEGALTSARRVYSVFAENFELAHVPVHVAGSIGVAMYPEHGDSMDELLQHADIAMYRAKKLGMQIAEYTAEDNANTERQLALIAELRNAIYGSQLTLHYQPKFVTGSEKVIGVEALVRWQHPHLGLIPPVEFIGAAERTGLIRPLTQWVLDTGLAQQVVWQKSGIDVTMAINLSPCSLTDVNLVTDIVDALRTAGADPKNLVLEVTEGSFLVDPVRAIDVLRVLRSRGIGVSIDDYGTGYSSLTYLRDLPIMEVKIDRSFVAELATNEADKSIVASTIQLAHALGFVVVAEGIEDESTLNQLAAFGCDYVQGFHLGRPQPADVLTPFLNQWMSNSLSRST